MEICQVSKFHFSFFIFLIFILENNIVQTYHSFDNNILYIMCNICHSHYDFSICTFIDDTWCNNIINLCCDVFYICNSYFYYTIYNNYGKYNNTRR